MNDGWSKSLLSLPTERKAMVNTLSNHSSLFTTSCMNAVICHLDVCRCRCHQHICMWISTNLQKPTIPMILLHSCWVTVAWDLGWRERERGKLNGWGCEFPRVIRRGMLNHVRLSELVVEMVCVCLANSQLHETQTDV